VLDERPLDVMQLAVPGNPFDGDDFRTLVGDRERQTAIHPPPIKQHRAGAALTVVATLLRPGQAEVLTQQVEDRRTRVYDQRVILPVHIELELNRDNSLAFCQHDNPRPHQRRAGGLAEALRGGEPGVNAGNLDMQPNIQTNWMVCNHLAGYVPDYTLAMVRDSAKTRARLLTTARDEFTEHGLAGARVDRIAAQAGVNKQRIYALFGSKDKLFESVIGTALDEHIAALGLPTDNPADYVGRIYDFHREHPQLLRLMQWESLQFGQRQLPNHERRAAYYAEKVDALAATLDASPGRDTAATLLTLIGLAAWPHALPQLTRLILEPYVNDAEVAHRFLRERVVAFAAHALDTISGASASTAP